AALLLSRSSGRLDAAGNVGRGFRSGFPEYRSSSDDLMAAAATMQKSALGNVMAPHSQCHQREQASPYHGGRSSDVGVGLIGSRCGSSNPGREQAALRCQAGGRSFPAHQMRWIWRVAVMSLMVAADQHQVGSMPRLNDAAVGETEVPRRQ
ncbi:MAG: hypothetical protein WAK93_06085, partial [Solirubrobacteraceae bacterium]